MRDAESAEAIYQGDDPAIEAVLADVCRITGMGFAAVARVTEDRWIACQVLDRIEFGLEPGGELAIKTTICDEIREHGEAVVIDSVADNLDWRTHHTPMLYGFESYASFPIRLADGRFYGTLCAIDPEPHAVSAPAIVAALETFARQIADILSARVATRSAT